MEANVNTGLRIIYRANDIEDTPLPLPSLYFKITARTLGSPRSYAVAHTEERGWVGCAPVDGDPYAVCLMLPGGIFECGELMLTIDAQIPDADFPGGVRQFADTRPAGVIYVHGATTELSEAEIVAKLPIVATPLPEDFARVDESGVLTALLPPEVYGVLAFAGFIDDTDREVVDARSASPGTVKMIGGRFVFESTGAAATLYARWGVKVTNASSGKTYTQETWRRYGTSTAKGVVPYGNRIYINTSEGNRPYYWNGAALTPLAGGGGEYTPATISTQDIDRAIDIQIES